MSKPTKQSRFYDHCVVLDCTKPLHARGLCDNHYSQCRRLGALPKTFFHGYAGTAEEVRHDIHNNISHILRRSK